MNTEFVLCLTTNLQRAQVHIHYPLISLGYSTYPLLSFRWDMASPHGKRGGITVSRQKENVSAVFQLAADKRLKRCMK